MIILTGADGFVGQHLAPMLLKKFGRQKLLCITGSGKSILAKRGKKIFREEEINYITADLLTGKNFDKIPRSPKIIIHLAANTDTAVKDHRINDEGTKNIFSLLKLGKSSHFIYTSTTVIFSGRDNVNNPINDKTIAKPTNEYGRSKLRAEEFLKSECLKNKIPLTILRINTIYGNDPRKYKLFGSLKNYALKNSVVSRLNWPGLTGLVHVDDVAKVITMIANSPPQPGKIQTFLVYSENLSLSQISNILHKALKKIYKPVNLPDWFWKMCSNLRRFIPIMEYFLPGRIYNFFWRTGLIVDDVIYCKSKKLFEKFPDWGRRELKNYIKDTF